MLHFVVRVSKKYYLQRLLEECKYKVEKTKIENLVNDDLDDLLMKLTMNVIMMLNLIMLNNFLKFKTIFYSNKSLIVYVNHALLGFHLYQFYSIDGINKKCFSIASFRGSTL